MRSSVTLAKKYLSIAPAIPPKYWTEAAPLERARMEYEDEKAGGFLKWFPKLALEGKEIFDIGCGYGGRTVRFAELGAKRAVGLEPSHKTCWEGKIFAAEKGVPNTEFVVGYGEQLPFSADSFDIVTSYDVFEHVADLGCVLDECLRILRPGGSLYAVFPPFFHPTGAHLESWISRMPWPHVLFNCETLMKAINAILAERNDSFAPMPLRRNYRLWGLNRVTIRSFRALLRERHFSHIDFKLSPLFSHMNSKWEGWRMKYYAFIFWPLRSVPVLRELFVHRIMVTLVK